MPQRSRKIVTLSAVASHRAISSAVNGDAVAATAVTGLAVSTGAVDSWLQAISKLLNKPMTSAFLSCIAFSFITPSKLGICCSNQLF
jgi:hypothetical protein